LSPISAKHEVYERTRVRNLKLTNYAISGGTGPGGAFLVGDTPTVNFKLTCERSAPTSACPTGGIVSDLQTNSNLSGSLVSSGPSTDRQRIYGPNGTVNIKTTGTLTFNMGTGLYTYVFPTPIPAQAFPPLNNPTATPRPNVSGSYTVYLYVTEQFSNPSFRDYASVVQDFNLVVGGVSAPARPRQVISNAACNSCHIETALHGTTRRDPEACGVCHTNGAQDRIEGGTGISCTTDDQCPGHALGWEACRGTPGVCTIIQDPTPNITIKFPILVHKIHFARLLEGYAERNDIVFPGQLAYVGFQNNVVNLSEILFPQDVRNCTKCHADAVQPVNGAATCSSTAQCGIGQECKASKCVNRAWVKATGDACTSCHDADHAFGHVQINTWQSPDGPIETCEVCHGEDADFAVEKVHNIWNPYVPPYPRTKE
jgi:OmcA/MtrC family decaheme c-type cytochrome